MTAAAESRPKFTERDAVALAAELYATKATARELPSERDQNFHLRDENGGEFVLKIGNSAESVDILQFQNAAMERVGAHIEDIYVPRVFGSKQGKKIEGVSRPGSAAYPVRLVSYLPATVLARFKPHSPDLLHSLGCALGQIDRALADFSHPAAHRELKWDLKRADWIRDHIGEITESRCRALVQQFIRQFDQSARPTLSRLRTSVIHNDANDYNVLVTCDPTGAARVCGIIDFGDIVESYTIGELAVALAYTMLDKLDPLGAARHVISGYHREYPIAEVELEALYSLACMRLCVSVVNSTIQGKNEPDNEYLKISEAPAWALLEKLSAVSPDFAHYAFRDACGMRACPKSAAVVAWVKENPEKIGPVVEAGLKGREKIMLDLSVGSLDLPDLAETEDVERFTRRIFDAMKSSGARVAVGRYDEARLLYISDVFKPKGRGGLARRSVHLGIDLFMEPGSAVLSPIDGVVHSFRNNDRPLDYGPTIVIRHDVRGSEQSGQAGSLSNAANEAIHKIPSCATVGRAVGKCPNSRGQAGSLSYISFFTLYGHLSEDSLEGLYPGKPVTRGDRIGRIGDSCVNGGWPPHLHFHCRPGDWDSQPTCLIQRFPCQRRS